MADRETKKNRPSFWGSIFRRLFLGGSAGQSIFEEELVRSPGRTALSNFLSKKLAIIGIVIFLFIFLACFILPIFFPLDLNFQDSTQSHIAPGYDLLSVPAALRNNALMIDAGGSFSAGIDREGKLYTWGKLSDKLKKVPRDMGRLVAVSCGLDHALALNENGEVFTWGNDRLQLSPIPMDVRDAKIVRIEAGNQISVVLDDKGKLYVWGNENFVSISPRLAQGRVVSFAVNASTAYAVTEDNNLYCLTNKDIPLARIPEGLDGRVAGVATNDKSGAVWLTDGTVVTFGSDDYGARNVPEEIQGHVKSLSAGRGHFAALLDDGSVVCWGMNNYGQADPPVGTGAVSVSADYFQNYAIDASGHVESWGLRGYLMGTDHYGRDMFRRLLIGGQITLTVGAVSVIIAGLIGVIIGGISGFYGGKVDMLLMRFGEIVNAIPFLPLAIILSAYIGNAIPQHMRMFMIMVILGMLSWPSLARLTRAQILVERENEFVTAAKAMGIKEGVIIFKHILPNVIAVVLVNLTLGLATCMLTESSLSFLGFGIMEPNPSWGNMLTNLSSEVIRNNPWRWVFPCIFLGLACISINLVGDAFRDAIDPKSNDR